MYVRLSGTNKNIQSDRLESAKVNSMDGQFVKYTQVNFKCY